MIMNGNEGYPHAVVKPACSRCYHSPIRRTDMRFKMSPACASDHLVFGRLNGDGIGFGFTGIIAFPVKAHLPNVAMHIVEAQSVAIFHADLMRFGLGVMMVPRDCIDVSTERCGCSSAALIFPLSLGGK